MEVLPNYRSGLISYKYLLSKSEKLTMLKFAFREIEVGKSLI